MNATLKAGDPVRATRDINFTSQGPLTGDEGKVTTAYPGHRYLVLFNDVTVLVYAYEIEPADALLDAS